VYEKLKGSACLGLDDYEKFLNLLELQALNLGGDDDDSVLRDGKRKEYPPLKHVN